MKHTGIKVGGEIDGREKRERERERERERDALETIAAIKVTARQSLFTLSQQSDVIERMA